MRTLAERLKFSRVQVARLNQKQLSFKSGLAQQMISKLERGEAESTSGIVSLARACGVDPLWLAEGVGSAPPSVSVVNGSCDARQDVPSPTTMQWSVSDLMSEVSALVHRADPGGQDAVVRLVLDCIRIPGPKSGFIRAIEALTSPRITA